MLPLRAGGFEWGASPRERRGDPFSTRRRCCAPRLRLCRCACVCRGIYIYRGREYQRDIYIHLYYKRKTDWARGRGGYTIFPGVFVRCVLDSASSFFSSSVSARDSSVDDAFALAKTWRGYWSVRAWWAVFWGLVRTSMMSFSEVSARCTTFLLFFFVHPTISMRVFIENLIENFDVRIYIYSSARCVNSWLYGDGRVIYDIFRRKKIADARARSF